jgi:hypothetical protein
MSWRGQGQYYPCYTLFGYPNFILILNFYLFPLTDIRTRSTNFTVHYDIHKTLLQWNQSINVGILISLTHFYFHYTRQTAATSSAIDRPQCIQMKLRDGHTTRNCTCSFHTRHLATYAKYCGPLSGDPNSPLRRQPSTWFSVVIAMNYCPCYRNVNEW